MGVALSSVCNERDAVAANLAWIAPTIIALLGARWWSKTSAASRRRAELEVVAATKRAGRDAGRADFEKGPLAAYLKSRPELTAARKQEIASMPAFAIVAAIKKGTLKSADVTAVFIERAIAAGRVYNAVTEEMYGDAMQAASFVDASVEAALAEGRPVPSGLLLGLPVSIKDCLAVRGTDCTMGLAQRCFKPFDYDSLFVTVLRSQGAIPFVRGNTPQAMMVPESENNVWGTTENPWRKGRTAGGSSSGEATLVAARAAPVAIGTDIGGSIRIPAHNCGVYGFKPTPQRFTHHGKIAARKSLYDGQRLISSSAGPLANCVADLALVTEAWLCREMWRADPTVPPLPFCHAMYDGAVKSAADMPTAAGAAAAAGDGKKPLPLRIGYYVHDGFVSPAPVAYRAVADVKARLEKLGHTLVPFTPPAGEDAAKIYLALMSADGNMNSFIEALDGEKLHPIYDKLYSLANIPASLRPLIARVLRLKGDERLADILPNVAPKTAREHWVDCVAFVKWVENFTAEWKRLELDCVICPGNVVAAVAHGNSRDVMPAYTHTFTWNMLHYPVGSVPVTTVRESELDYYNVPSPVPIPKDSLSAELARVGEGSVGMPFGVQVAALPFHDELVLRVMREIEAEGNNADFVPPNLWEETRPAKSA